MNYSLKNAFYEMAIIVKIIVKIRDFSVTENLIKHCGLYNKIIYILSTQVTVTRAANVTRS